MATKNPFSKLKIRDLEDEEETQEVVKTQVETSTLSTLPEKKKKKVRPEEKRALDNERNVQNDDDGFERVTKKAYRKPNRDTEVNEDAQETIKEQRKQNKGAYEPRNDKVRPGKRQFDRISGTGRGKEVAKEGAGGKHTWGNADNQARNAAKNFNAKRGVNAYSFEDRYFESALKEKTAEETTTQKVEEVAVVVEEEATNVNEVVEDNTTLNKDAEDNKDRKDRKKKKEEVEVKEEDKLKIPENAVSLKEYKEKMNLNKQNEKKVQHNVASDLQVLKKNEEDSNNVAAKKKGKPVKKSTNQNDAFDKISLTVVDDSKRIYNNKESKGYLSGQSKFVFKDDEFPSL